MRIEEGGAIGVERFPHLIITDDCINYKGRNYYPSCDSFIRKIHDGSSSYCVKPLGHGGNCVGWFGETMPVPYD